MLAAAVLAFRDILSPPFRGVLLKSLALTIGLLVALWLGLQWLVTHSVTTPWPWVDTLLEVVTGVGLVVALGFLVAPVAALFVGLFLDGIADAVEHTHYPADPPGQPLPLGRSLRTSLKFLGAVLVVNALALPLVFMLGFGAIIFLVANAYLLGREYFELASLRHHDQATVRRLRAAYSGRIFAAGLIIAAILAIPIVNLLGPLFATAFMVHFAKRIEGASSAGRGLLP